MSIMTKEQYFKTMHDLKPNLYAFGEKVEDVMEHPMTRANINAIAITYEMAKSRPILTATSHLTGKKISRFTHVHMTQEDLYNRLEMMRWLTPQHGGCVGARCVGNDAIQAVYATTYDIDQDKGTKYHDNFKKWLQYIQDNDLSVAGMMTDIKGNRGFKPGKQPDPDSFVHIVERREDGIIVRGAKAHMSGAPVTHEFLVIPTEAMTEGDADFALSFAIPNGTLGVTQIFEAPAGNFRWLKGSGSDLGNPKYGIHGASLVVFDNVFVPWNRVFMCGEYDHSSALVLRFADMHRFTFSACKAGHCDLAAGAAVLAAEQLGTERISHIVQKVMSMVELSEGSYACSLASAARCSQTPSKSFVPHSLYVNIGKVQGINAVYRTAEYLAEIAGGLVCTHPSQADFDNPDTKAILEKYLQAKPGTSARDRVKLLRFIEYLMGQGSVIPAESCLGGGAPAACRVSIKANTNINPYKEMVKRIIDL